MNAKDKIRVLCYGDSNTWGTIGKWVEDDKPSERFDAYHRWTGILQKTLGDRFEIIEEGLGGRSTIYERPGEEWKNGEKVIRSVLNTHRPIDLVILMLGTNDLQINRSLTAEELPEGISRLVDIVKANPKIGRDGKIPEIMLIAPVEVMESCPQGRVAVYDKFRREIGRELSLMFPEVYKKVAAAKGCHFLNAQEYAKPCRADGVHISADGHIRLGKAVAKAVEDIFPETEPAEQIHQDGSLSSLYMRFDKKLRSAQGMDIYGDRAYILYDTGVCAVYDLLSRNPEAIDLFKLGSYNDGVPSKDYLNHANSCMFGTIHLDGNPLPLLYVTAGTGIGADEDGFFYRCAVENIVRRVDEDGTEHHTAETVQVITYKPDGIENVPYEAPCWGCPAFFVDTEKGYLYIFSAKYRTKRGCVPEGEKNAYIITKFALPQLSAGPMVRLTPGDILDQFSVESDVLFTQGGMLVEDRIYYTFGCPKIGYPLEMMIFDLKKKALTMHVNNMDEAFYGEEIECCGVYDGKILCNTCDGGIFELRTKPFVEEE
ncbi:MAG: hypothetical protein E7337_00680 [Clostridiales bacterium]|nr:hypothetical protein [Clostridiales bacterium]